MKTVANLEELRRLAAASGGTAVVGGQTINAQGARMRMVKPAVAEPAPAPTPAPTAAPQAHVDQRALALAIQGMGETLGRTLSEALRPPPPPIDPATEAEIAVPVAVRVVGNPGERPRGAVFTIDGRECEYAFVRNGQGATTSLSPLDSEWPLVTVTRDKTGNLLGVTVEPR